MKKFFWVIVIILQVTTLGLVAFLFKQNQELKTELLSLGNEQLFLSQRFAPNVSPAIKKFGYSIGNDALWVGNTLIENNIAQKIGEPLDNEWAQIIAEPAQSHFVYFSPNTKGNLFQYDLNTKTIKKMSWTTNILGPDLDQLSEDHTFEISPCPATEVRCLIITDFRAGIQKTTTTLPEAFSYTQAISEMDGGPMIDGYWGNNGGYYINVYTANPLEVFDTRYPVYSQYINPKEIFY